MSEIRLSWPFQTDAELAGRALGPEKQLGAVQTNTELAGRALGPEKSVAVE